MSKHAFRKDRYDINLVEPLPVALRHDIRRANIIDPPLNAQVMAVVLYMTQPR